jgi:hypothetical protein
MLPCHHSLVLDLSAIKDVLCGQILKLIMSVVEHMIALDVRYLDSVSICLILVA